MILDEIAQRKEILMAIIDSSEDAIISKDLNGRVTSWNKSAERVFGYTESEMIGQYIAILIPEERKQEEDMILSNLRQGRRIEHYQTIRVTKGGRRLHISLTISPIKNAAGVIIGASKIARDITKQKEDEALIRMYTERLELINSVGRSISERLDVPAILQVVTDATTSLSGAAFGAFFYNKTDAKGETYMLYALSGAPREAFDKFGMPRNTAVFKMTFEGLGVVRSGDITKDPRYGQNAPHHGMPAGHLPVVSYMAVPVTAKGGTVIGGLFFGHPKKDMFDEVHESLVMAIAAQASVALDNAKLFEEIQALNSKKDEFIGFASHELKTPLTTMKGYLQLAEKMGNMPPEVLPKLTRQVVRLESIIAELLDISKIEAGKLELNFEPTSLQTVIKESIETVNLSQHNFQVDMPDETVTVHMDGPKISQVLINLLANAIKYSAQGTNIWLSAMRLGDNVQISVRDEGIGMATEHLDRIFNQYYRVSDTTRKMQGMGLGLYISKEIVERHFGKIWAESIERKGSTFHVVLPIDGLGAREADPAANN